MAACMQDIIEKIGRICSGAQGCHITGATPWEMWAAPVGLIVQVPGHMAAVRKANKGLADVPHLYDCLEVTCPGQQGPCQHVNGGF